jgi:hypothetical protein
VPVECGRNAGAAEDHDRDAQTSHPRGDKPAWEGTQRLPSPPPSRAKKSARDAC